MAKVKAGVGLANVVVDELNVLTTRTQRMVFKKWRNGGCDCDGGKRLRREVGQQRDGGQCWRRRDTTTAKAARPRRRRDDHGEGGTTTAKVARLRREGDSEEMADSVGEGGTATRRGGTATRRGGTARTTSSTTSTTPKDLGRRDGRG